MPQLARLVLNLGATEFQLNRYKVMALLFRLGQAEEIERLLKSFDLEKVNWKKYNFYQLPSADKKYDAKTVLYQVMYGYRIAFPKKPDSVKFIMERREQLLKDCNI